MKKALLGKQRQLGYNVVDFTSVERILINFLSRHIGPDAFKLFQDQTLRAPLSEVNHC